MTDCFRFAHTALPGHLLAHPRKHLPQVVQLEVNSWRSRGSGVTNMEARDMLSVEEENAITPNHRTLHHRRESRRQPVQGPGCGFQRIRTTESSGGRLDAEPLAALFFFFFFFFLPRSPNRAHECQVFISFFFKTKSEIVLVNILPVLTCGGYRNV